MSVKDKLASADQKADSFLRRLADSNYTAAYLIVLVLVILGIGYKFGGWFA